MPRRGRKKILGKRPDIEQERRADQLQDLERELHRKRRQSRRRENPDASTSPDETERTDG